MISFKADGQYSGRLNLQLNLDCSTEVAVSLFLAFQVLDPWVTILMFPSVTCLNKLLSLVQSCLTEVNVLMRYIIVVKGDLCYGPILRNRHPLKF